MSLIIYIARKKEREWVHTNICFGKYVIQKCFETDTEILERRFHLV